MQVLRKNVKDTKAAGHFRKGGSKKLGHGRSMAKGSQNFLVGVKGPFRKALECRRSGQRVHNGRCRCDPRQSTCLDRNLLYRKGRVVVETNVKHCMRNEISQELQDLRQDLKRWNLQQISESFEHI